MICWPVRKSVQASHHNAKVGLSGYRGRTVVSARCSRQLISMLGRR